MSESLEDFLNLNKKYVSVEGSLMCQECDEIVNSGKLNEDDMVLYYTCSSNHNSKVQL